MGVRRARRDGHALVDLLQLDQVGVGAFDEAHHLHVEADYDSHPAGLDPKALPPARVDEPINQAFSVHEVIDLLWASRPDEGPRLHLDQRTGPDSGRELTIIDERSWTRIDNLGWYEAPLEGELWQLWLDDAQHALHHSAALLSSDATLVDADAQIEQAYVNVAAALEAAGASFDDIAKLTMYVVGWGPDKMGALGDGIGRAARRLGVDTRKVMTLLGVAALVQPDLLVEVEVVAVLP